MTRMDPPYLSVDIFPEPGHDEAFADVCDLLLSRGARPDGDGFFIERHRRMHVQRAPRSDAEDFQSVEILMSAGPLGDPGGSKREIATFARHVTELLVAVVERTRPLYGGVGIEEIFPTPAELRHGFSVQGFVSDPFFVREDLLARSGLRDALSSEYRRRIEGPAGTVFASSWPFVDGKESTPGGLSIWGDWAGGQLLGRVTEKYLLERERARQNEE
jgi:hypothetical protein